MGRGAEPLQPDFVMVLKERSVLESGCTSSFFYFVIKHTSLFTRIHIRQGRLKNRLEDNVSGWTVLEFAKCRGKQRKMEGTGCEVIYGTPSTPRGKGLAKVKETHHKEVADTFFLGGGGEAMSSQRYFISLGRKAISSNSFFFCVGGRKLGENKKGHTRRLTARYGHAGDI